MRKIRVLIVDDSLVFRELLVRNLSKDPAIEIVGTAQNAFEARDAIVALKPDVMTLDIELPRMDGLEFLRKLMPQYPMPVVVISALSDKVFDAMKAGAVEFVAKPKATDRVELEEFISRELPVKIKVASVAKIGNIKKSLQTATDVKLAREKQDIIVAIGASTGGTQAIASVIKEFGPDIPGTVIVQHMPPGFTEMYANRLNDQCRVLVKEAKNGDYVKPGQVLIAPGGDAHMELIRSGDEFQVTIKKGPKVNGHCPSVDVLFNSVAKVAKDRAVGIILTGMGGDGAKGLLNMRKAGAHTIGEDEDSCVVYGMPKVAYELGAVEYQVKLEDVARKTYQVINKM